MLLNIVTPSIAVLATLAGPATAFFRMPCPSRLIQERIDPVVRPGGVSAHVHHVAGGNGFGYTMDYAQARRSQCSSCPIKEDLSAYWTPKLYFRAPDGTFTEVPVAGDGVGTTGGMTVYYLQRPGPNNDKLLAFPPGFRMVAGNPFQRNYTGKFPAQAVSFMCLDYSGSSVESKGFPNKNCPDGLRAQIFFPSCWNGKDLDTPDHKSHMAYPAKGSYNGGPCPLSHPKHMVSLFYEIIYSTGKFPWSGSSQPFVFAQGDPTGYGMHGDFVNGWDVDVLQKAIDNCNDAGGEMEKCPYFNFYTNEENQDCSIPTYVQEDIKGPMKTLPGCNPVQSGPALAKDNSATCTVRPTISLDTSYFKDVTTTLKYAYLGCGNDSLSTRTFSGDTQASSAMTVEMCVKFCSGKGYTYAGLEYSTQCYCGNSLAANRDPETGILGQCKMKCGGAPSQTCGGPDALSIYKKCTGATCSNAVYQPMGGKPVL